MEPFTEALLQGAGVRPGMKCADVACGGGQVTGLLADMVGPDGRVVGIDIDALKLETARADARKAGRVNVEFRRADLTTWSEQGEYDLVYGRFIISHLANRPAMIERMRDALVPGGMLILEDVDFSGHFCDPPSAAFERYCESYRELLLRRGGDADVGPKLEGLCADAELFDIQTSVVQPVHRGTEAGKAMALTTLMNISDAILAERLTGHEELGEVVAELASFTDDPASVISLPRVFQVWGRRGHAS